MLRDDPAQFSSVQALLREMVHEKTSAEEQINASAYEDDCEELLFVLTNMRKQYGAVWMTDKHIRSMIAQRLGSFYVIPSSLHECMILPADAGQDAAQLNRC